MNKKISDDEKINDSLKIKEQADTASDQGKNAQKLPKISKEMEEFHKKQMELANKFKDDVLKKYDKFVKAVIIFGSLTRGDFKKESDIDILVIIDDTTARFTPEMKDMFDLNLHDIAKVIDSQIVVQPAWTLTEFWDMARIGHPLLYTIVTDGWALYDTGFFIPIRKLLELGKIPTTLEAVERFMESVPKKIKRVETAKLYMVAEDLYYSMLNSSQAVLMFLGLSPPAPKFTPLAVKEHLIDTELLESDYLRDLEKVIEFRKGVEHKTINDISGEDLDMYIRKTKRYVERMEELLLKLQKTKKENMIDKNYEILIKASVTALKQINKLPQDPKDLPDAIKTYLIESDKIHASYNDVFKKVLTMRKLLDENKADEIPQRDVELMREYVRRFIRDMAPMLGDAKKEINEKQERKKQ